MGSLDKLTSARRELIRIYAELECADHISRQPECEDGLGLIARICHPGCVHEISADAYWHFLRAFCPHLYNGNEFCIVLARDAFTLFWSRVGKYYCRRLTMSETCRVCRAAGLPCDDLGL